MVKKAEKPAKVATLVFCRECKYPDEFHNGTSYCPKIKMVIGDEKLECIYYLKT